MKFILKMKQHFTGRRFDLYFLYFQKRPIFVLYFDENSYVSYILSKKVENFRKPINFAIVFRWKKNYARIIICFEEVLVLWQHLF